MCRVYLTDRAASDHRRRREVEMATGGRALWLPGGGAIIEAETEDWWRADSPAVDFVGTPDNGGRAA